MPDRIKDDGVIGARVRAARELAGLTGKELAALVECSGGHLLMAEQGERPFSHGLLVRIARAFDVPLGALDGSEPLPSVICATFEPRPEVLSMRRGYAMGCAHTLANLCALLDAEGASMSLADVREQIAFEEDVLVDAVMSGWPECLPESPEEAVASIEEAVTPAA